MSSEAAVATREGTGALSRILARRRAAVSAAKAEVSLAELEEAARSAPPVRSFHAALESAVEHRGHGLICESKRRSPSGGALRPDLSPAAAAEAFRDAGAACLSVLTEPDFFGGSLADLQEARHAAALPVLRKDFVADPWQVAETRASGADCLLLILAALEPSQARELEAQALELGLEVLLEATTAEEAALALSLRSPLVGINSRNLESLETDLARGTALIREAAGESGRLVVGESGIRSPADLLAQREAGARAFLVGETLMRAPDLAVAARALVEAGMET